MFFSNGYVITLLPENQQDAISITEAGDFEAEEEKSENEENEKEEFKVDRYEENSSLSIFNRSTDFHYLEILSSCHFREITTPPPERFS